MNPPIKKCYVKPLVLVLKTDKTQSSGKVNVSQNECQSPGNSRQCPGGVNRSGPS